jgi:hypothetical protein
MEMGYVSGQAFAFSHDFAKGAFLEGFVEVVVSVFGQRIEVLS